LKGWLVYRQVDIEKNTHFIQYLIEAANKYEIDLELVKREDISFETEVKLPDFAIMRCIDAPLTARMESMGVKTFNNSKVSEICNNKANTHRFLANKGIPQMETYFPEVGSIDLDKPGLDYPFVLKSATGSGGKEVFLVEDKNGFLKLLEELEGKEIIIQKIADERGKDLRVYVIGKEIIAGVLRTSDVDFRANYSLGGKFRQYFLNSREEKIVKKVIEEFDFGLVGIDLIFDGNEPVLNEIEDVVGCRTLYQASNIDIADLFVSFIRKSFTYIPLTKDSQK